MNSAELQPTDTGKKASQASAGSFTLTWRTLSSGARAVSCTQLPGFSLVVPRYADVQGAVSRSLKRYLSDTHGIEVDLRRKEHNMTFDCFVVS